MPPRPTKAKVGNAFERIRQAKLTEAREAEQKLLKAMAAQGGLSVVALANLVDGSRSSTGERLRRLSDGGKVEKDHAGRWRLKAEETAAGPTMPPPST